MRRRLLALLVGSVAFAMAVAPLPVRAIEAHVLRYTDGIDVTTLDPLLATSGNVQTVSQYTMAHLVTVDAHGQPQPELIESIPTQTNRGISADGKTITYHLRRGVRWSDGAPFDADDVAYTLRVIADGSNQVADHDAYDTIARFDEPDKFTLVFHLKAPYAPFVVRIFSSAELGCVLPKHVLGASTNIARAPYNALPIGIGPFRYTAFRRGDRIEMEANPSYFRGAPKLKKIVYKLIAVDNTAFTELQTGEIDLWSDIGGVFAGRVKALPGIAVTYSPTLYVAGAYLNLSAPPLRDVMVRRALRLAADRQSIFEKVDFSLGTLSESVVAPSTDSYANLPRTAFDPAAATKLLDDAGWKPGADGIRAKDGVRLALSIVVPTGYPPSAQTAELLRASWQKLGIDVAVKAYASAQFFAPASAGGILQSSHFDVGLFSFAGSAFADITDSYGCAYRSPKGFNSSQYCDPAVDADVATYARTYDATQRAKIAARFQKRVDEDVPVIVIYVRAFAHGHTPHLVDYHPTAFGIDDIMKMDVTP